MKSSPSDNSWFIIIKTINILSYKHHSLKFSSKIFNLYLDMNYMIHFYETNEVHFLIV